MSSAAPSGPIEIVGRGAELSRLDSFLDEVAEGPAALVLEGESGIGKSTLWKRCVAAADDRGWRVLLSRPAASEAKLSFAGLADLLGDTGDVLEALPSPQRNALGVALLQAEPVGAPPDPRTVSAAVLSALREAAARGPVLVALDDVQWLDPSTDAALGFAVRRLEGERVGLLLALRDTGSGLPFGISRAFPDDRVTRLSLEPLSLDDLGRLLRLRLGAGLPRPTLRRLHEMSGGNPFFALEIARAALRGDRRATGQALPIPKTLREDLIRDHVGALSKLAREALLFASACSRPKVGLLETAVGRPNLVQQLSKAIDAGIVEADGNEIRFTHPLYGSAIYADASREHRHRVHRRLAEVVEDPEERARHLALAADGPDLEAAAALEAAARSALARGAPIAAGDLCEFAVGLTPSDRTSELRRLRMLAADYWLAAADYRRAVSLLEPVVSTAPPGPERAQALWRLGRVLFLSDDHRKAVDMLAEALGEEMIPPRTLSSIHSWQSHALAWTGNLASAEQHAEEALRLAELGHDPAVLAESLMALAGIRTSRGRGIPQELVDRALQLEDAFQSPSVSDRPSHVYSSMLFLTGQLDQARKISTELLQEASVRGDEDSVTALHWVLGRTELLAGNWETALAHYERMVVLTPEPADLLGARALVRACLGNVAAARAEAEEALDAARRSGPLLGELLAYSALGFLELSLGNAAGAHEHLRRAWNLHQDWGIGEPAMFPFVCDHVEVLIELGKLDQTSEVLSWLDERGRGLDRPWALAVGARYRGLLAAGEGDFQAAFAALDEALKEHERLPMPFELGRTLLVLGSIRRRAKQKRPAREALEEALEIFERLGAPLWAEKARAELARIGGRRAVAGELTEAEARVAKLAAAGRTNREIADALFMSVRTVEGHLSRAYHKLGIRSRTELALFFGAAEDATNEP